MLKINAMKINKNRLELIQILFFFIIIWLAYFLKFRTFGLYEDDYWFVGKPINLNFHGLLLLLKENVLNIQGGQGRIIGFTLPQLLAHISYKIGGISGVYIFGSLLLFFNSVLLYRFVRHFLSVPIAFIVTILYILYPADTTKPLLIHIFQLQLSLTFVLLALNKYAGRHKALAFIFAFFSLLTYENAFLPFLSAPLFVYSWKEKILKRLLIHLTICFLVMFILLFLRKLLGETRAGEVEGVETIKKIVLSLMIGPFMSIVSFINIFRDIIPSLSGIIWMFAIGISIFTAWILVSNRHDFSFEKISLQIFNTSLLKISIESERTIIHTLKIMTASLFMLVCAYLFAFTHYPPVNLYGRDTSVHLASSVAGSILLASMINLLYAIIYKNKVKPRILHILIVIYLSFLFSRGFLIQKDYEESWQEQKQFWREIVRLTGDAKENTIILVKSDTLREDLKFIGTYTWPIPEIYNQLFIFNSSWNSPPRVAVFESTFNSPLKCDDLGLFFEPEHAFLFDHNEKVYLQDHNFIFINYSQKKGMRTDTTLYCDSMGLHSLVYDSNNLTGRKLLPVGKLLLNN